MVRFARATAMIIPALLWAFAANASEVTVRVENVRNDRGFVFASICRSEEFLRTRCLYSTRIEAKPPAVVLSFQDVSNGSYAIQVFHDENGDGNLSMNSMGLPTEGYGFSNNVSRPRFRDAEIDIGEAQTAFGIRLRYP